MKNRDEKLHNQYSIGGIWYQTNAYNPHLTSTYWSTWILFIVLLVVSNDESNILFIRKVICNHCMNNAGKNNLYGLAVCKIISECIVLKLHISETPGRISLIFIQYVCE